MVLDAFNNQAYIIFSLLETFMGSKSHKNTLYVV